jgi:hypothetical protein
VAVAGHLSNHDQAQAETPFLFVSQSFDFPEAFLSSYSTLFDYLRAQNVIGDSCYLWHCLILSEVRIAIFHGCKLLIRQISTQEEWKTSFGALWDSSSHLPGDD